jgi:hypothetical protein
MQPSNAHPEPLFNRKLQVTQLRSKCTAVYGMPEHCTSRCVSNLSLSHTLTVVVVTYLRTALSGNTKDTTQT